MSVMRAVTIVASLACCTEARADIMTNAGRKLGAGAVEKLQPALVATLADAEARGTRLEDHIGTIASGLIDQISVKGEERIAQVDHLLETRLLQATVEVSDLTDRALSSVGGLVDNGLIKAQEAAKDVIKELRATTNDTLQRAGDVLKERIADVGREVDVALEKADRTLAERIAQVDEAVGRRLGNVDVIASKQRLAIEETAVRVAVLIGLVAFTVFILRRLYARYSALDRSGPRGGTRSLMFARELGVPLFGHLVVAGLGTGVLLLLYHQLPLGARAEAAELIRVHRSGFVDSLERFDFTMARFHASQLEYLAPDDPLTQGALMAKTELLRDVFARPTLLGTDAGIASLRKRLDEARRIRGSQPDPDLLVIEAMLRWQTGDSRRDELRAASLCARALRIRHAGGFALRPLARAYIETFVDAPYADDGVGLGRDRYTLGDLRATLEAVPAIDPMHPIAARIWILRLMRTVDAQSSTAYAETIEAHVELLDAIRRNAPAAEQAAARQKRTEAASKLLEAWQAFDAAFAAAPDLARDPSILQVFRLNDAVYSRAKWFVDDPRTDAVAPYLLASPAASGKVSRIRTATAKERLRLAPPRIVWARRYQHLIEGPARKLFELQESNRFAELESAAYAFEQSMIDMGPMPRAIQVITSPAQRPATATTATSVTTKESAAARSRAAQAAAVLGLYVSDPKALTSRMPFALARKFAPDHDEAVERALRGRGIRLL